MAKMVQLRHQGSQRRSAYTLLELLVVIAIIGILAALTAGATIQVMGYQRNSNTESNIKSLSTILDRQWRAVIDQANQETIPSSVKTTLAGGSGPRARVIWKKLRLNQEFPMNFSEIFPSAAQLATLTSYGVPPKATYKALLGQMGVTAGQSPPQTPQTSLGVSPSTLASESAVCLYLALQENRKGVGITTDDLPVGSVNSKIYVDPTSGPVMVKEIADAWGYPLAFYRWATANTELNLLNPAAMGSTATVFRDPLDPEGLLMDSTWWSTGPAGGRALFEAQCHLVSTTPAPVTNVPGSGGPASYYMVPVIASAGRDNMLGILPFSIAPVLPGMPPPSDPMAPDMTANSYDNIYNYRLRVGQRGDQ
ncbi:MAG TPA: type II secretion system protein [Gemmataceae bacterium]|nr:type II secretion system protein [Gemmataceae bacterium]